MIRALLTGFIFTVLAISGFMASATENTDLPAQAISVDASSSTVPTASYLQLDSALDANCTSLSIFNSTAKIIYLATGASSSEIRIKYDIPPSASAVHYVHLPLAKGIRLSARAVGADATTGFLVINCLQ